jgi:hypothetical protein
MQESWTIKVDWEEPLDSGSPEERTCFAALGIRADDVWLTEGSDALANRLRQAPLLSAYHLAEWIAWNWWRLRWEPRSQAKDWAYAHRVATIGSGYIWPNLTIFSDGERTALMAKPTGERPQTPFRYIADRVAVVPASKFETEVDVFVDQVLERLDWAKVVDSNLEKIWLGILEERKTPELARARKLEALLGQDPDESDPRIIDQLAADAKRLSVSAVDELAAEHGQSSKIVTVDELRAIAGNSGFVSAPKNVVHVPAISKLRRGGQIPAWRLGAEAAQALRVQERLDGDPITDKRLAEMAGVKPLILNDRRGAPSISFALDESPMRGRVVLRSKWHGGRRFELARLLGDRLVAAEAGRLFPATRAYTYRQKMQRSFAAELLSPFEAVDAMLEDDYSNERQQDIAEHFEVSPLTIRTLLVNHGRLEREELDGEFEVAAA